MARFCFGQIDRRLARPTYGGPGSCTILLVNSHSTSRTNRGLTHGCAQARDHSGVGRPSLDQTSDRPLTASPQGSLAFYAVILQSCQPVRGNDLHME